MSKFLLFVMSLFVLTSTLEAQRCGCYGCRRYMDITRADEDAAPYGYMDNINYPNPYALPINRYFNYCRPMRCCNGYNASYLNKCIHYTKQKNGH